MPYKPTKPITPIAQTFNASPDMRTPVTAIPISLGFNSAISPSNTNNGNGHQGSPEERISAHDIVLSIFIMCLLLLPIAILEFVVEPFHRGFFCDDESIRYPYKNNSISFCALVLCVILFPLPILIGIEISVFYRNKLGPKEYIKCCGCDIPAWLYDTVRQYFYFFLGFLFLVNVIEIAKFVIGRLRPHFLAVCQPEFPDGSTCKDSKNATSYMDNYICMASGFSQRDVQQARLSFFSGHSALAVYSSLYMVFYMEVRLKGTRLRLVRHLFQFLILLCAWFTCLTRVTDYWHHPSDVIVGILMGVLFAVITARIARLPSLGNSPNSFHLNRYDTTATLQEVH